MKYYLYVSHAKVDMLLQQIPYEAKKKIAAEFKVNFGVLSASRKSESETTENSIARLDVLCEFIRKYGDTGTVDSPGEYVADSMALNLAVDAIPDGSFAWFADPDGNTIGLWKPKA